MRESINRKNCVNLSSVDTPNLIPMFNSYCRAAISYIKNKKKSTVHLLPCQTNKPVFKFYEEAGLIVHNDKNYFCIVSSKKGGACVIFDKKLNQSSYNYGALYKSKKDKRRYFSTQTNEEKVAVRIDYNCQKVEISCPIYEYKKMYPTPFRYIILRCLNLTFMRFQLFNEIIKKILVRYVIKSKSTPVGTNTRVISFSNGIEISDDCESKRLSLVLIKEQKRFYSIHMASQAYWRR